MDFFIRESSEKELGKVKRDLYYAINRGRQEKLLAGISVMQISYGILQNGVTAYFGAEEVNLWSEVLLVKIDLLFVDVLEKQQKAESIYIRIRN